MLNPLVCKLIAYAAYYQREGWHIEPGVGWLKDITMTNTLLWLYFDEVPRPIAYVHPDEWAKWQARSSR